MSQSDVRVFDSFTLVGLPSGTFLYFPALEDRGPARKPHREDFADAVKRIRVAVLEPCEDKGYVLGPTLQINASQDEFYKVQRSLHVDRNGALKDPVVFKFTIDEAGVLLGWDVWEKSSKRHREQLGSGAPPPPGDDDFAADPVGGRNKAK